MLNTQRAGSFCLLLCLLTTAASSCDDVERREGIANCKMERKLAKTTAYSSFDTNYYFDLVLRKACG